MTETYVAKPVRSIESGELSTPKVAPRKARNSGSSILRGKMKPTFTPSVDETSDYIERRK